MILTVKLARLSLYHFSLWFTLLVQRLLGLLNTQYCSADKFSKFKYGEPMSVAKLYANIDDIIFMKSD